MGVVNSHDVGKIYLRHHQVKFLVVRFSFNHHLCVIAKGFAGFTLHVDTDNIALYFYLFTFNFLMFNPTRSQIAFVIAIVVGLVLGKLIKNFPIGMILAIVLALLITVNIKRK